ncbi:hypothetical protein PybrP1_004633, partial [[Pythium] brassicae (nom. inval.)]
MCSAASDLPSPAVSASCDRHDTAVDLVMAAINALMGVSTRCSFMMAALSGHAHLISHLSARHPTPSDSCCEEAMDSAA